MKEVKLQDPETKMTRQVDNKKLSSHSLQPQPAKRVKARDPQLEKLQQELLKRKLVQKQMATVHKQNKRIQLQMLITVCLRELLLNQALHNSLL
jgi:hypothetical protein